MNDQDDADRGDEPVERAVVDDVPTDEPDPPDLANYVLEAVDRQDADDLRELAQYALERAAWSDRDLEPETWTSATTSSSSTSKRRAAGRK